MSNKPSKPARKKSGPSAPSRRKCRECAVQVLFCEFFNSHQLTRAVSAVHATSIGEELGATRSLMTQLKKAAESTGQRIDKTMSLLFHASETGELPKSKDGKSYTEIEGEDILSELAHTLEETSKSLRDASVKVAEIKGSLGSKSFTMDLLGKFHSNQGRIKEIVSETLRDWKSDRLSYEDWSILHLGATELLHFPDIPASVVINEYIEIAKEFGGSAESAKFVNGILDQIRRDHTRNTQ
ncbi:MAG: transcription antitermination factor NusB [Candidatus Sumerlaeia bacterium]|nr:transcription antitermination factor NusB [Candidatus Sumerlaeia bacterium]